MMPDIAKHLPEQSKTVEAVYAHYKKVGDTKQYATRSLGASQVGHPCERYLWYLFRHCCQSEKFDGRMYRLFETGELEEARFVKDLRGIGCEVHTHNLALKENEQFKVSAFGGHLTGYLDGAVLGVPEAPKTWHVFEGKTHNAKSFRALVKKGVEKSKPQHFAQMMVYMHLTGMSRALYLARNKDTDELYSERIRYNATEAGHLMERAERIITATAPPERISGKPDSYQCKWCDAKDICWGGDVTLPIPSPSCRQCCHATPKLDEEGAFWTCPKYTSPQGLEPDTVCKHHLLLPGLIIFAEPTDYGQNEEGNDFIEFTNEDGTKWGHGDAAGCYSSEELMRLPVSALTNELVHGAKELFGATVVGHQMDILQRYPENDTKSIWVGKPDNLIKAWKEQYNEDLMKMTPLARCNLPEYSAIEFTGDRVAIIWKEKRIAEIQQRNEVPF